ncbi:MAG: hypothetical protein ACUVSY_06240 [Roseiflexus sp.]
MNDATGGAGWITAFTASSGVPERRIGIARAKYSGLPPPLPAYG